MNDVYIRIENLCQKNGIDITTMCKEAGVSRAALSEFKMGRTKKLSTDTLAKISDYLDISVDYLLTGEYQKENRPVYDDEALELMEEMHKRPELKVLFNTTKKAKREDIEAIDKLLKHMAGEDDE